MHRSFEQQEFMDQWLGPGRSRSDKFFQAVDRVVNWEQIESQLSDVYSSKMGRPSFAPLLMFKILLIQLWYNLGDPEIEDALNDRRSFARFVGLPLGKSAPDHSTVWRFRAQLVERGLMTALTAALMRQIEDAGLVLKQGTLMDATFVLSAARPPSAPRKDKASAEPDASTPPAEPDAAAEPSDPFEDGKRSKLDPEAQWGKKGRKAYFGYKLHIAVDQEHRIIRAHRVTPANVNDCTIGPQLVQPDGAAHYGDKGYASKPLRQELARHGLADGIMQLGTKHYPMRTAERLRNRILAAIRGAVEGVFGEMKKRFGLGRARYTSLAKVQLQCDLAVFAFNLKTLGLAA